MPSRLKMKNFCFYLFVESWAICLLYCADSMVSDRKRKLIQDYESSMTLQGGLSGRHICFAVSFFVLFFISAMRDHVGRDYGSYAGVYQAVNAGNIDIMSNWLSPGYVIICRLLGMFSPSNYFLMFATMSFMTAWYLYKALYKMSCNWAMSLYIFISFCLYYESFNQFRQSLASVITAYACYFLMQNDRKKFLLYILFAMSIHKSAFIMAGLCFVYKRKINAWNLMLYLAACIVLYVGYSVITRNLIAITNYEGYLESSYVREMYYTSILKAVTGICLLAGCLIFSKQTIKRSPNTVVLYNAVIICAILQILTLRMYLISRMARYFYMMYMFLIPEVLKTIKENYFDKASSRLIKATLILMLFVYHCVYYYGAFASTSDYNMLFWGSI